MKLVCITMSLILFTAPSYAWPEIGGSVGKLWEDAKKEVSRAPENIEKGVQSLGDATADVVTLGEHGRRRDKERKKAEAEKARIQAENAKNAVKTKLQNIITLANQTKNTLSDYTNTISKIDKIIATQLLVSQALNNEIEKRESFTYNFGRAIDFSNKTNKTLESLLSVYDNKFDVNQRDGNQQISSLDQIEKSIAELAQKANQDVTTYLAEASKNSDGETIEAILSHTEEVKFQLDALKVDQERLKGDHVADFNTYKAQFDDAMKEGAKYNFGLTFPAL